MLLKGARFFEGFRRIVLLFFDERNLCFLLWNTRLFQKRGRKMKKLYIRNQSEEMTLKELFEQFLVAKQCINVSPYTLRFYEGCYRHFTDYIDEETPCSEITLHTVNSYILALKGRSGINDITINTYLRGMRAILYYGMEIVCIKPFKIVLLRAEKKQKETYSAHEIAALIQKPDLRTCSFAEFRNWAIVNYLAVSDRSSHKRLSAALKQRSRKDKKLFLKSSCLCHETRESDR